VLDIVDSALTGRALVVGRPPPEGRDLDLLVRAADAAAVADALRSEGFVERAGRWARFADCAVEVVDLVPVESWGLPAAEADALFDAAAALEGRSCLARPAPAHVVLIEARRWAGGGLLTERRSRRVAEAAEGGSGVEPGEVWAEVEQRAPAWGIDQADLDVLRGGRAGRAGLRAVGRKARRAGRGAVITLSGIDGSGKSSQADALRATLEQLGFGVETVWARITINPSLGVIAAPVKRLLGAPTAPRRVEPSTTEAVGRPPGFGAERTDQARALRLRYPVVNHVWLLVVALVNALTQWRAVTPHVLRGKVVVCDRYTLDSAAHLRYKYGPEERFRWQSRVVKWISPRPLRSFLLDVPGDVAHARKPEKYTADQLEVMASLYREEAAWLGVAVLDGQRPKEELCAEIGAEVWAALADRRGRLR
jgi:thymidylate kinase